MDRHMVDTWQVKCAAGWVGGLSHLARVAQCDKHVRAARDRKHVLIGALRDDNLARRRVGLAEAAEIAGARRHWNEWWHGLCHLLRCPVHESARRPARMRGRSAGDHRRPFLFLLEPEYVGYPRT